MSGDFAAGVEPALSRRPQSPAAGGRPVGSAAGVLGEALPEERGPCSLQPRSGS